MLTSLLSICFCFVLFCVVFVLFAYRGGGGDDDDDDDDDVSGFSF